MAMATMTDLKLSLSRHTLVQFIGLAFIRLSKQSPLRFVWLPAWSSIASLFPSFVRPQLTYTRAQTHKQLCPCYNRTCLWLGKQRKTIVWLISNANWWCFWWERGSKAARRAPLQLIELWFVRNGVASGRMNLRQQNQSGTSDSTNSICCEHWEKGPKWWFGAAAAGP